jgi:hypothetical protein
MPWFVTHEIAIHPLMVSGKMKQPLALNERKVRLLHQQNELNETLLNLN